VSRARQDSARRERTIEKEVGETEMVKRERRDGGMGIIRVLFIFIIIKRGKGFA